MIITEKHLFDKMTAKEYEVLYKMGLTQYWFCRLKAKYNKYWNDIRKCKPLKRKDMKYSMPTHLKS